MSLFLPSNLSPNFEEITPSIPSSEQIEFKFQVNTNGSCVRSYKLEILNDKNDAENPDDNILATFYGSFESPLYNKEIGIVSIDRQQDQINFEIGKDYRWRIRLYEDLIFVNSNEINIEHSYGNTYVGEGNIVGSTKNVIWLSKIDDGVVEEKFIQAVMYSHDDTNDFNPFYEKLITQKEISAVLEHQHQKGIRIDTGDEYKQLGILNGLRGTVENDRLINITGIVVDINEILPEYRKKLTDGNMYLQLQYEYGNEPVVPNYDTNQLPKLITGISNLEIDGYQPKYVIEIDERQAYIYHDEAQFNLYDQRYSLVYIQREQIYSIDKSIGQHQLTKITLDEPFDYNTFHNTNVESGLVSDNFDYGRVYIDPVVEFDSKLVPSAYINIAYSADQLVDTKTSEVYNLLTEQPNDWETNCEKYFKYNDGKYSAVTKTYVEIYDESEPENWNDVYKQYYERVSEYELIKRGDRAPIWPSKYDNNEDPVSIPYYYKDENGDIQPVPTSQSQPEDWETEYYTKYYVEVYKYYPLSSYSSAPLYEKNMYYRYGSPIFNIQTVYDFLEPVLYYSYGISQSYLSTYKNSLTCVQLTNYVAKTGECSLFSDLKFKPDRFYMYQIFIPDQTAPNYDVSKADNPYKFYAGVQVSDFGDIERYYYLGGQKIDCVLKDRQFIFDVNQSGDINYDDYYELINIIEDTSLVKDIRLYDYDGDGKFTNSDVLILAGYYAYYANADNNYNNIKDYLEHCHDYLAPQGHEIPNCNPYVAIPCFDYNNRNNTLPIYSNHQIGNTNQYMCFIQPNLGIYEDRYKPCVLQIYNNQYKHDLYITNYNGSNQYNKDYSIDTLDDSQWLVTLTYPNDISNLEPYEQSKITNALITLTQKPQTKYKIYTNFVNSIPEAYFYYRDDKMLSFKYYDYYNYHNDGDDQQVTYSELGQNDKIKIIKARDIIVKCDIADNGNGDGNGHKNLVPIKYYQYTVVAVNPNDLKEIIDTVYDGEIMYDGKYQCALRGFDNYYKPDQFGTPVDNPTLYRIQITAEDEYGNKYDHAEDVYFGYNYTRVTDRINSEIDCLTQSVHIDFSPVKTFHGNGDFEDLDVNDDYIYISSDNGLTFADLHDASNNTISISEKFLLLAQLSLDSNIFNSEKEHDILEISTDKIDEFAGDSYVLKFDTRVVLYDNENNLTSINGEYLYFKLYKNGTKTADAQFIRNIVDTSLIPKENFQYAFSTEENKLGVYIIEESEKSNIDAASELLINQKYQVPSSGYNIYTNSGENINNEIKDKVKIPMLCVTISTLGESATLTINNKWEEDE